MLIYSIRNKINGKQLIGQTVNSSIQRWGEHRRRARNGKHCNPYFQRAWDKHEEENFEFLVVDSTAENMGQLNALEIFYIATTPDLYNITAGGSNSRPSPAACQKMSEAAKRRYSDPKERRKISEINKGSGKGRKLSLTTRQKISESLKGNSNAKGYKHSPETRRKVSEAARNRGIIKGL